MRTKVEASACGCPRCGHRLTPVVARKDPKRSTIGYCCPEPYCDYFQSEPRSPAGELSEALRRSQNEDSRFFNRRHKRDGTLVRGRFFSKPVTTRTYRRILVRYIDQNAVRAGLARTPWQYPWGSARCYVHSAGPRWLERSWIERESAREPAAYRGEDYVRAFGAPLGHPQERLVESRIESPRVASDDLDELLGSVPQEVLGWMRRKARIADGHGIGLPLCDSASIRSALSAAQAAREDWQVAPNGRRRSAWDLIEPGLLRTLAGLTWEQIADATGSRLSSCQRRFATHLCLIESDPDYARIAAELSTAGLRLCHPATGRGGGGG